MFVTRVTAIRLWKIRQFPVLRPIHTVCHSVHKGVYVNLRRPGGYLVPGVYSPGGVLSPGGVWHVCSGVPGGLWCGGVWSGVCGLGGPPKKICLIFFYFFCFFFAFFWISLGTVSGQWVSGMHSFYDRLIFFAFLLWIYEIEFELYTKQYMDLVCNQGQYSLGILFFSKYPKLVLFLNNF